MEVAWNNKKKENRKQKDLGKMVKKHEKHGEQYRLSWQEAWGSYKEKKKTDTRY